MPLGVYAHIFLIMFNKLLINNHYTWEYNIFADNINTVIG